MWIPPKWRRSWKLSKRPKINRVRACCVHFATCPNFLQCLHFLDVGNYPRCFPIIYWSMRLALLEPEAPSLLFKQTEIVVTTNAKGNGNIFQEMDFCSVKLKFSPFLEITPFAIIIWVLVNSTFLQWHYVRWSKPIPIRKTFKWHNIEFVLIFQKVMHRSCVWCLRDINYWIWFTRDVK